LGRRPSSKSAAGRSAFTPADTGCRSRGSLLLLSMCYGIGSTPASVISLPPRVHDCTGVAPPLHASAVSLCVSVVCPRCVVSPWWCMYDADAISSHDCTLVLFQVWAPAARSQPAVERLQVVHVRAGRARYVRRPGYVRAFRWRDARRGSQERLSRARALWRARAGCVRRVWHGVRLPARAHVKTAAFVCRARLSTAARLGSV
jgi:hypothetical protein